MGPRSLGLPGLLLGSVLLGLASAGLFQRTIRQRRQTLAGPAQRGHNTTALPGSGQPVVFHHVYNINVPASAVCSVDLDAPGGSQLESREPGDAPASSSSSSSSSSAATTEHTLDGENQIVFTHRINVPRQACSCADAGSPDLKALLSRLEMLEAEVSTLRGQCGGGTEGGGCCHGALATGALDTRPFCSGHGNYSAGTCGCVCEAGWTGPNCSSPTCPLDCSENGACVDEDGDGSLRCVCRPGFHGEDCSLPAAPAACPGGCSGRGRCVSGACTCDAPWVGLSCSELACPGDCSGRGRCVNGACTCDAPWAGLSCSELACPGDCSGRGRCVNGACTCDAPWAGLSCSELACPGDCSGQGACYEGACVCFPGFSGEDCGRHLCPEDCSGRGLCGLDGRCVCHPGFHGDSCSEQSCPAACRQRGRCVDGRCVCDSGFAGEDCSVRTCPGDCGGRGSCGEDGLCVCLPGFSGEDCSALSCPAGCRGRGHCVEGVCVCHDGYAGEDCGRAACPNDCHARGVCLEGRCLCGKGFAGEDCGVEVCPSGCSGRGRCEAGGRCVCDEGYAGPACGELVCASGCAETGRCEAGGRCECDEGYVGEDCSQVSPPGNLSVTDVTPHTVDLSWSNEKLVTQYVVTYVPTGPGGLHQEFSVPGDGTSAHIEGLEPGVEYMINVYAVLSNRKSVPVSARVATSLPQPEGLRFKSVRDSSVEVEWDPLEITFDGWELYIRNTKEENGKILNVLPSTQTHFNQSGLGPGQEYEVSLRVIKNNMTGPQTTGRTTTKIEAPRRVQVKDVTASSALFSWAQPVTEVNGVTVTYGPTSDPFDRTSVDLDSADTQYSAGGLKPDREYVVSLTSKKIGVSSDPVTRTFSTDLDSPRAVQTLSRTENSISLEWSNSEADVGSYRVKYTPFSGGSPREELVPSGGGNTTRATITGLRPGTEYGIGITAVKDQRESLPATTNAVTDLDPPRDLEVKDSTETSLALRWKKPKAKLSGYTLSYSSTDGHTHEVKLPPAATGHALNDLAPDTLYSVTLMAHRGPRTSAPVSLSASTASHTFYSAPSDVPEQTPRTGPDHNVISIARLDTPPDPQLSGAGPALADADEPAAAGRLNVSGHRPDGFRVWWEARPHAAPRYDRLLLECRGLLRPSEVKEVRLGADSTAARVRGLNASTEYRITLHGVTGGIRSPVLGEAVAATALEPTSPGLVMNVTDVLRTIPTTTPPPSTITTAKTTTATMAKTTTASTTTTTVTTKTKPQIAWDTTTPPTGPPPTLSPTRSGEAQGGPGPLGDLTLTTVNSTSVGLSWSAPDSTFDHFLLEATVDGLPPRTALVPGGERAAWIEGLSAAARYEITLYGLLDGARSLPLKVFVDTEELAPPALSVSISGVTWDSMQVSWRPPPGQVIDFEGFVVELTNLENPAESHNLTLSGDAFSLPVSGLTPDTGYRVAVYGMLLDSFLEPAYGQATTASQAVVGNLFVSNVTSEGFSISWNGTQGQVDGYMLEIIDSDWLTEPQEHNMTGDIQSYQVTGLRPSTDYVAYLYGVSKGSRTNAVSSVGSTAAQPDLSRLVVSNITSDRFSLSWQTGEKAFDNFVVEVRESAAPSRAMGRALTGDVRSTVMTGLRAATQYDVKMYASSGGHNSLPLFAVATTEDVPQLGPLTTASVSPDNLTLSWSTVSGHFDVFVVRVSDSLQLFDPLEFRVPSPAGNVTVSDLLDATDYDIELYGMSHGRRGPSVFAHAITAPLPRVENLTVSNITPYGFRLSWETKQQQQQQQRQQQGVAPPVGSFKHFQVVVTDSGWLLEPHEFIVPGNQTHLDLWGLITGIGYEVRLTGVSRSGLLSRPLTMVAVTEAEPEIEHLFVSDVTADGFRLSWAAADGLFDRFVIRMRDTKKLSQLHVRDASGDERTAVFTGLMSGTEYDIELYGVTLEQRSHPILGVAQTGLGSPSGLQFSDVTDRSAVVQWAEPLSKVDSYRVVYVPLQQGTPMSVTVDGSETHVLLPSLDPGKTYQVTVMAVRGLDESYPSTDTVTTLSAALDRPRALEVLNITETSARLLWAPAAATVDGYVVTYSSDSVSPVMKHVSGNIVEFEMDSLVPATGYTVGVYALKDGQRSGASTVDFTTDADSPKDLQVREVHTDRATLSWTAPRSPLSGYRLSVTSSRDGSSKEVMLSPTASSYSMSNLIGSTEYSVTLQAVAEGRQSPALSTTFTTAGVQQQLPRDCAQLLGSGESASGLYTVYLGGERNQPVQAYCDMTTDQGGWLVFLRRQNGKTEFFRNWRNYTAGFGNKEDEFWLGLANLHKLTSAGDYELRVDLRDKGESAYAHYDRFRVAEPRTRYKLYVGAYSGTAGDSLTYHNGRPFSTYDNDNDVAVTNCALSYKGAFWYKNCHRVNLMGKYGDESHSQGINWYLWTGHTHSVQFAEMKMRPINFRNIESRRKRS